MTAGDVAFAQAIVRGAHTALAAVKQWAKRQQLKPHDERFIRAADAFADAAKDWVRAKADELTDERRADGALLTSGNGQAKEI